MNKNPFSFYDFLGYLFPGIIALMLTLFVVSLHQEDATITEYFSIKRFVGVFFKGDGLKWWESTILLIVPAYVVGHIVAYLSSVIVEYFANNLFGYPSYYLLHKDKLGFKAFTLKYWKFRNWGSFLWRLAIAIILLPVYLNVGLLGFFLKIVDFIIRPLDEYVRNSVQRKLLHLSDTLNLAIPDVNSKADYHRIVMHYVYLNIPNCQRKADNYVAIYGFLRAMTLIACAFFDYLLLQQLGTINIQADFDMNAMFIMLALFAVCNVLFMGFVKYYRRFTLENYMALLTEKVDNINGAKEV